MSDARKAAEAFIAVGHVWDGPTCIRAVEIITSLLAEQPEAGADPVRRFGLSVLAAWWDEGNPGDLGGDDLQDFAEHVGLWHRVERHADGVECEWCQNDGSGCGELTEAGDRAVREADDLPLRPAPPPARDEVAYLRDQIAAREATIATLNESLARAITARDEVREAAEAVVLWGEWDRELPRGTVCRACANYGDEGHRDDCVIGRLRNALAARGGE